ncbi:MAG: cell wall biosynthesis protein [Methanosphaera sp.]|nr:cell wall biosynthesis protein [Methanosphaera sp.]
MEIILLWTIAFFITLILTIVITVLFSRIGGNLVENIRGGVPRGVGLAPFLVMVLLFPAPYNYFIAIIGVTAFIDDIVGRRPLGSYIEVGQFFRAIGIIAVFLIALSVMGPIAILVSLVMVQIFNIADMQPGVAGITVIIMSIVSFTLLALIGSSTYYIPILLLLIALGYISQDYSGYIMMGEIGNHSFGVALGICFALVSAETTRIVAPNNFILVEFIIMIVLILITVFIIAKIRENTLEHYLEKYLHINNPTFGDYVMDILTGGGLGDLVRRFTLGNTQINVESSFLKSIGVRRLIYNPFAKKQTNEDLNSEKLL